MSERLIANDIELKSEPYIRRTNIDGFFLVKRPRFFDDRGSFQEIVRVPDIEEAMGHQVRIMQTQGSFSLQNVLRGIHAENQIKLITPQNGRILAVIVD